MQNLSQFKSSFAPVVDEDVRVLVLGSLPGEQSLAQGQYYAHPRNQFWRLIGAVVEADLISLDYEARLETLLNSGVGLWDVVASATRSGSLDAAIRELTANDLPGLVKSLPRLRAIAFNGGTAARVGRTQIGTGTRLALVPLPSSSPALTKAYRDKLNAWLSLRHYL